MTTGISNGYRPSNIASAELADQLAGFGRLLAGAELDQRLARTVLLGGVLAALPEIGWASITSAAGVQRRPATLAASAEAAETADALQYRTGVGPCLQALAELGMVRAEDLATEGRWRPFVAAALADTPVRGVVSCSLAAAGHPTVSLNLYAAEPLATARPDRSALATVAAACAVGLTAIDQRYRADHLERALASSRRIGAAMGVLMASLRLTEEQAFDALRTVSQHSHRKLRDVADDVLLTGELPTVRR
jgi:ANTAR domain